MKTTSMNSNLPEGRGPAMVVGIVVCFLVFVLTMALCSCTKIDNTVNNVNHLTVIEGDSIDINVDVHPTINASFTNISHDTIVINIGGAVINMGDILINIKDTTSINLNLFNYITIHNRDSLIINNNLVNQITCPYKQCTCIIVNCIHHNHKCKHNKVEDCKDKDCDKHHPKCN